MGPVAVRARLGELLIARGLVRASDVQNALAIQASNGEPIGLNLVRLGALAGAELPTQIDSASMLVRLFAR